MGERDSVKAAANRRIKKSVLAYLDGEEDLHWIMGVIKTTNSAVF